MAKDLFHDAVKAGLNKDGWKSIRDNVHVQTGGVELYIDIIADRLLIAEKGDDKIAVEVKSFIQTSDIYEFHLAVGQVRNYQLALAKTDPERVLYLAVPDDTYERFFVLPFVQEAVNYNELNLLVYNVANKEVVQWIK
ncbi:MAG: element excision factor XisH family protein [Chloroflexota bacterium]